MSASLSVEQTDVLEEEADEDVEDEALLLLDELVRR